MFKSIQVGGLLLAALVIQESHSLKPRGSEAGKEVNSQTCIEKVGLLDKCLPKLVLYGDRNFDPPRTDEQLDQHCAMLDENLKCVSSYSRECLPSFARNLYSVMTRRLKTQFAKRCKSKEGRRDFLNLMVCAEPRYMEPSHKCMDAFVAHLEHTGIGNQNRQIELTCCTFQLFQECIFSASKNMQCPQRVVTAEKSIDYVRTIINSMGGDMMDLMCGRYDSVQACNNGYAKVMSQFRNITEQVQRGALRPQSNSPLKPMLQLFINNQES